MVPECTAIFLRVTMQAQQWLVLRLRLRASIPPPLLSLYLVGPRMPRVAMDCLETWEEENTKAGTLLHMLYRSPPLKNFLPLLLSFPHLVGRVGGR